MMTLYYIHDPMCSWCWGFRRCWETVQQQLPSELKIEYIVGGLAPDSDEPMPLDMQQAIAGYWRTIQSKIPGTEFNYDFWKNNIPRRSTYPACRAVLAAKQLSAKHERAMIFGIQTAYYLEAKNPSDNEVLINIAESVGLDKKAFTQLLQLAEIDQKLQYEIKFARAIGASGFPSLILEKNRSYQPILINYTQPNTITEQIYQYL